MCARYTLVSEIPVIADEFQIHDIPVTIQPRYNIAPTQQVPAVVEDRGRKLVMLQWGLVPQWAADPTIGRKLINARAETLNEKPSFRSAFRKRRCLIPADGFYEWRKDGKQKIPMYLHLKTRLPFGIAGLYEKWTSPEGTTIATCIIITTQPNTFLQSIHDRMPVIIPRDRYKDWLDPLEKDPVRLQTMLKPFDSDAMTGHVVSRAVNSPAYDGPDCIAPVEQR